MTFIDTHAHPYDEAYAGSGDEAVARAVAAGVGKIVVPDIDRSTRGAMLEMCGRHPGTLFPCIGVHPTSVAEGWKDELEAMLSYSGKAWAIGEVGIDLYWSREFRDAQKEVFRVMLEQARDRGLPVIIHSRDATEEIFDSLEPFRGAGLRGVFHAFSGSIETFRRMERYGDWFVGIGGVVTFRKASIAETVREIPLERILLETDSPYLTPVPHRGERNESAYIPLIAGKIAEQKGMDMQTVAEVTTRSAEALFGI